MKIYNAFRIKKSTCLLPVLFFLFSSFIKPRADIQLLGASYEEWTSGIKGGGSGKEYYFKIKILSDHKITFDSLWIDNKSLKTYLVSNQKTVSSAPIRFKKNDTIIVQATEITSRQNSTTTKPPIQYKGEALLRYYSDSKPYFIKIKKLTIVHNPNRS